MKNWDFGFPVKAQVHYKSPILMYNVGVMKHSLHLEEYDSSESIG